MNIFGLQMEQADEGLIWYAWVDKKFYIDGYGYDNVKQASDAIANFTQDRTGFRLGTK